MNEIIAKSILQTNKPDISGWFYHDYNMNLYRGCSHGCIYCDSRSLCYGIDEFEIPKPKKNAIEILESELMKKRKKGICGMGSMSDPYNPLERKLELTRKALELFLKYGFGTSIITKSDMILRDLDILKKINEHHSVLVSITITTSDLDLQKKIEPYCATTIRRFEALKQLNDAGIKAGICLDPILPFINDSDENLISLIDMAKQYNVHHIFGYFGVTKRDRQQEYFYKQLDKHFPGVKEKYIKTYGNNYICTSPRQKELRLILEKKCKENNILFIMKDINESFLKTPQQLRFIL